MILKQAFLTLTIAFCSLVVQAQYSIPEAYLERAILIEFPNIGASGSGFFLLDSTDIYLVSARHVLFHERVRLASGQLTPFRLIDSIGIIKFYSKDSDNSEANLMAVDFSGLWDSGNLKIGINTDIVVVKIGRRELESKNVRSAVFYNSFISRNGSGYLNGFFTDETLKFKETKISDDVFMIGYPKSLGLQQNIQYDFDRPLLRKGILAGRYQKNQTLIVDCPSFFGNSGGPVIEIHDEKSYLIGIVTQLIPFTDSGKTFVITQNSGFSIIEPIDKVLEIIKQFKK